MTDASRQELAPHASGERPHSAADADAMQFVDMMLRILPRDHGVLRRARRSSSICGRAGHDRAPVRPVAPALARRCRRSTLPHVALGVLGAVDRCSCFSRRAWPASRAIVAAVLLDRLSACSASPCVHTMTQPARRPRPVARRALLCRFCSAGRFSSSPCSASPTQLFGFRAQAPSSRHRLRPHASELESENLQGD